MTEARTLLPPAVRHLGLRARLTVALAIILAAAMSGAFIAIDRETGTRVRSQIDRDLGRDAAALTRAQSTGSSAPTAIEAAARQYLDDQPSFGSSARLYIIQVTGGSTITNEPELLGFATGTGVDHDAPQEQRREQAQAHAILSARSGHHVLTLIDAGELDHRINAQGAPDEIRRLADGFDHMLDRLQDAFDHERDFVADASHELRTPLTVISGQIELLSLPGLSADDTVRIVQLVHVEIARMSRLIEDMLLLATSDRGLAIHKRRFDVQAFLNDLFRGLQGSADRRFELSAPANGTLEADEDRIAQVIRNLTRNAIEHTGPGGLVRLTAEGRGERLELAVEDDGPGITDAERDRIFDRFHRTDSSRSRSLGGSGLGLAIARAIVLAHGGRIWADQSPEGGARIALELPLHAGPRSARQTVVAEAGSDRYSDRSGL